MQNSRIILFKISQEQTFHKDIQSWNPFSLCSSGNRLVKLSPFLDENGLLRSRSRLANSQFDYAVKNPIILDAKYPLVRLLLFQTHCDNHHSGVEHTRKTPQLHYWVFSCRAVLRQVINACHACRRQKAAGLQPQMADLPMCRFPTDTPFLFLHCGLDSFGPYPVFKKSMDPVHQKRSGLLITCLITRAVHEELTYSLPADSFINSFRRFVSRRGCPGSIKSDRATNCVGANKSLNEAIKVLISTDIANFFLQSRKFIGNSIPPQHHNLAVFKSA